MKTRWMVGLGVVMMIMLWASSAFALSLYWDPNSEADLAGYHIYQCVATPCQYGQETKIGTVGVMAAPTFPVPAGATGFAAVTAFDTSGNESEFSNTIPFDAAAPAPPTGLHSQ